MTLARLTSKGQTTIPKAVREHLGLKPGDRVEFMVEEGGRVYLMPVNLSLNDLQEILPPPRRKLSLEQIEEIIEEQGARQ